MLIAITLTEQRLVGAMTKEYRERVEAFTSALLQAKILMKLGIIDSNDYIKMEDKIALKYCIKIDSLYRTNDLINRTSRGNMSHD